MENFKEMNPKKKLLAFTIIFLLLAFPFIAGNVLDWNYAVLIACFICIYTIAVTGLDILFGYSGQISMGHAAFFAIGAYGSVLLHKHVGLPVLTTMVLGAVIAMLVGGLLAYPASKLVFHFLSLATIAFGEIVYQAIIQSPKGITGDYIGIFTKTVSIFGQPLNTYRRYYYFSLVCVGIFLLLKRNLINSRVGRAFIAIRENAHAADGMGVNVRKYKVYAFALSAFLTAFAGAMYAHLVRYISPDTFRYDQSVMFMTMLLFGGTTSIGGTITGVTTVLLLNEVLRTYGRYQLLIYGILLLLVIVAMPGGLFGAFQVLIAKFKEAVKDAKA